MLHPSSIPLLLGMYSDYIFRQFILRDCVLSLEEFFGQSVTFKQHMIFPKCFQRCVCVCQTYVPERLIQLCCSSVPWPEVYFRLEIYAAIKTDRWQEGISILLANRPRYAASCPWHALFSEIDIYNFALDILVNWSEHTTGYLIWRGIFLFQEL
jgi:hypothetical protein